MRRRLGALILSGGLVAVSLSLNPASALTISATTWTVSPGGPITNSAENVSMEDTTSGLTISCASSTDSGTLKSGTGLSGTALADTTSVAFNSCSADGIAFSGTTSASPATPWVMNAKSYNSSTGVSKVTITHISATISSSVCSAEVDGTSATGNNGKVTGTYSNETGELKISKTGGNLHIYNVSGCLGAIADGDSATFTGTYSMDPEQTITGS
jgi:hypothetical protein